MPVLSPLANLLYPPACLLCHARLPAADAESQTPLCAACAGDCSPCGPPVCVWCGRELAGAFDAVLVCRGCRTKSWAFDMARAVWHYRGAAQQAVCQFKYQRRWRLGQWLAEGMIRTAEAGLPLHEVDGVIPVPRHWLKHRLRGWNPVEQLAVAVAGAVGKPCLGTALRRARWTATQTRLSAHARLRNVQKAFTASERLVRGQRWLLIDDVFTSGATAHACALALKRSGARSVFVLTAARTPHP